jgi:Hint domain
MIWHAVATRDGGITRTGPRGLPASLLRGTLLCEIDPAWTRAAGAPLLHLARRLPVPVLLSVSLDDAGRLHLVHRQGDRRVAMSVGTDGTQGAGHLRITYHWDVAAAVALLTVEDPGTGAIRQQIAADPPPLDMGDALALLDGAAGAGVLWSALGTGRHPVGVGACFGGATPVATPSGAVLAAHLKAGDAVLTESGPQVALWSGQMTVPACGSYRPIRLVAPYFAAGADLTVPPHARIAVSGPEVEYLFDADEVLVEARHLVNGHTAVWADTGPLATWHGILFSGHHLVRADGCRMESLFLGGLAAAPDLARTTVLGGLVRDGRLPRHRVPVRRELCAFEAATLALTLSQRRSPVAA